MGALPVRRGGGPGGPECRECGRGSSLSVDYGLSQAQNTLSLFWDVGEAQKAFSPKDSGQDVYPAKSFRPSQDIYWGNWAYGWEA